MLTDKDLDEMFWCVDDIEPTDEELDTLELLETDEDYDWGYLDDPMYIEREY